MLADPGGDDDRALVGFVQGLRTDSCPISPGKVPWGAWRKTLFFWLPLFGLVWLALTGLALGMHTQWSRHEHLPYPIVQFTRALLPSDDEGRPSVFGNRWFWVSVSCVLLFHLNNFLHVYHPENLIPIRRVFDFSPLARLFPTFMRGGGWSLIRPRFYFAAVGIAYLLATDVSLSVGLGPFLFRYAGGVMANYGITMGGGTRFAPRIDTSLVFGGYVGMFMSLLYTGRHYYSNLARRVVFLPSIERIETSAVWGGRLFVGGFIVFVVDLCLLGLGWQIALIYASLTVIVFVVMGRIIAESGLFFIAPYIYPCVLIFGFFGEQALGPGILMIMFVLTCMLLVDPRETFMPYMVNVIKLSDDCKLKLGRTAALSVFTVFLGLSVAVPITLYFAYDRGVNWADGFATKSVPRFAADGAAKARQRLLAQDMLTRSEKISGWQRIATMKPDKHSTIAFGVALVGVLALAAIRLRFARWPLHPVLFLVWSGYAGYMMAWSFLLGCLLKVLTTRYGGAQAYQRIKPFMFGLIAGDMVAGLMVIVMGLIYNLVTGELPKTYWVLPG
ncbi:MAG: hypothetical protein KAI66_08740, partial [Lentisphaeria bacterium]|nr:hypothetical protein [Lentisphaeria bacterium]